MYGKTNKGNGSAKSKIGRRVKKNHPWRKLTLTPKPELENIYIGYMCELLNKHRDKKLGRGGKVRI